VTRDEIRETVLSMLGEVAPEADLAQVKPDVDLRDQLDLDSMDLLNFVISVDEGLGVDIPEADYSHLVTLDGFVEYLAERLGVPTEH
jgi:acyl carrier protein